MSSTLKFRKSSGSCKYKPWKDWSQGDYIIGTFIKQKTDKFDNPSYLVEVIETTLEDVAEGENFGLNSNGSLNYQFESEEVSEGQVIKVEYEGEDKIEDKAHKFYGKTFHKVSLSIASDSSEAATAEENDDLDDL